MPPGLISDALSGHRDWLSAVRAALGGDGNIAEALRTRFRRWGRGRCRGELHLCQERIYRKHNQEINCCCNQQKRDDGIEEVSVRDLAAVDVQHEGGEVRLLEDGSDQRRNNV